VKASEKNQNIVDAIEDTCSYRHP